MDKHSPPSLKGRGSQINPANRFARIELTDDDEQLEPGEPIEPRTVPTQYFIDDTQTIISEHDSPDIPFHYSLNVYRGCAHGCSYCFARPTHEYLGLGAGLDFETKIFVKQRAPELFRAFLSKPNWQPETITISSVTDCYQPIERKLQLTRQCLEVALEARQPIAMITKNALIARDVDLLREMAQRRIVSVAISITTLDQSLSRVMEPRTSSPAAKLRTVQTLAAAGVPVRVLVSPVIPGLTDFEIPSILKAAKEAGAVAASYILLRLPLSVEPVFLEWLARTQPEKREKVEAHIRATRGGKLYESTFGLRMRGRGQLAEQIRQSFQVFARKYRLDLPTTPLDGSNFRKPVASSGQKWLFDV